MEGVRKIIGVDGRICYHHLSSDLIYGRIAAGIGFPGRLPGYVCVLGEELDEDRGFGVYHIHLLAEAEDDSAGELLHKQSDLVRHYEVEDSYGNMDSQDEIHLNAWNVQWGSRRGRSILIRRPPGTVDDRIEGYIRLLQDRLRTARKSLHLGDTSRLSQQLHLIQREEVVAARAKDYPALAAVGYAVATLAYWKPVDHTKLPRKAEIDYDEFGL